MSREERKMAQIIASIERMEQRKPSSASRADSNGESDGSGSNSSTNASSSSTSAGSRALSLERMNSSEIHAQVQRSTRLGAKGKKLKPLSTSHGGVKVRSSKKAKTPQESIVSKKVMMDCKLTPKKRWIQLWNEQLSTSEETKEMDKKVEPEQEPPRQKVSIGKMLNALENDEQKMSQESKPTRPAIIEEPVMEEGEDDDDDEEEGAVKVTESAPLSPPADEQKEASISPVSSLKEPSKDIVVPRAAVDGEEEQKGNVAKPQSRTMKEAEKSSAPATDEKKTSESMKPVKQLSASTASSDSDDTKKPRGRKLISTSTSTSSDGLRVKTPQVTESSHLSPPLDRNSPATAASISPSAKTKDADPNSVEASSPSNESVPQPSVSPKDEAKANANTAMARKDSTGNLDIRRDETRDRSRKRSLERKDSEPLTEAEKRRAERRRKRKSNWDVGDPRFSSRNSASFEKQSGRSPSSDGNHCSSRFPSGRPSWRHSNSMDATHSSKSSFQSGNSNNSSNSHRSSFSGGSSSSRRGFYPSNSLPLDRSRSAGRSSSRYHYNNSYR